MKVDDLVWVWNEEDKYDIRIASFQEFSKARNGAIWAYSNGLSSLNYFEGVSHWDNWEKYEHAVQELSAPTNNTWREPYKAEMTQVAAEHGLSHWRCVSNTSNSWWQRIDGQEMDINSGFSTEFKTCMDTLREFDKRYPVDTKPPSEPKWHEYLKQGYRVVCEVWHDIEPVPPIIQIVDAIRGDNLYMGEIAWDFARPVPSECGKFFTGIKDGKTHLLPI